MATWRQLRRSIARAQGTLPYNNREKRRRAIYHDANMRKILGINHSGVTQKNSERQ